MLHTSLHNHYWNVDHVEVVGEVLCVGDQIGIEDQYLDMIFED